MEYVAPNQDGSRGIGPGTRTSSVGSGEPVQGRYFENVTPVTGRAFCEIPRSTSEDIDKALDAAHAAKEGWGKTSAAALDRLNKIADRIEANLEKLAVAETWDNGRPALPCETLAADMPLTVDHFR